MRSLDLKPVLLDLHPPVKRHVDLVVAEALQRNALQSIQQQRSAWGAPAPPHTSATAQATHKSEAQRNRRSAVTGGRLRDLASHACTCCGTLRHVAMA